MGLKFFLESLIEVLKPPEKENRDFIKSKNFYRVWKFFTRFFSPKRRQMFFFSIARVDPPNFAEKHKNHCFSTVFAIKTLLFYSYVLHFFSKCHLWLFDVLGQQIHLQIKSSRLGSSKNKRDVKKIVVCVTVLNSMKNRNLLSNWDDFFSKTFLYMIF